MYTMRKYSTSFTGSAFAANMISAVWNKGRVAQGYDPSRYRLDACGAMMEFAEYGDTTPNGLGWEIDHIVPASRGGSDDLSNLQPLQWENNRAKGDGPLVCVRRYA